MFVSLYVPRGYASFLMDKGVEIRYNGRGVLKSFIGKDLCIIIY